MHDPLKETTEEKKMGETYSHLDNTEVMRRAVDEKLIRSSPTKEDGQKTKGKWKQKV